MTGDWRVRFIGEAAVSMESVVVDALDANAAVHRLAARVRAAAVAGVRDVVAGMRTLVVHVDPLRCDLDRVVAVMEAPDADAVGAARTTASLIEIPVRYGGEIGPDLDVVATASGLSRDDVWRRHASTEYVVCFLGFLPGFPYLGRLDPALCLPRRSTPRTRVPAGSVAIAGEYTGIYPWESPGGWHVIGRTDVTLFDASRPRPTLLSPGDRVRFVPVAA